MTKHDPLCTANDWESFEADDGHLSIRMRCHCDLIAKARADERKRIWKKLDHLPPDAYARRGWMVSVYYLERILNPQEDDGGVR